MSTSPSDAASAVSPFKMLLLAPDVDPTWAGKIEEAVPGSVVKAFSGDPMEAVADIEDADAAYGTVHVSDYLLVRPNYFR